MKPSIRRALAVGALVAGFAGAASPVYAWEKDHNHVVLFSATENNRVANLKDIGNDNHAVRAQYGMTNGDEESIFNGDGFDRTVSSGPHAAAINRVIMCVDYTFNDDCSGEVGPDPR